MVLLTGRDEEDRALFNDSDGKPRRTDVVFGEVQRPAIKRIDGVVHERVGLDERQRTGGEL